MSNPTPRSLAATLRRSLLSAAESVALPLVATPDLETANWLRARAQEVRGG